MALIKFLIIGNIIQLFFIIPFFVYFFLSRRYDNLLKIKSYQLPFLVGFGFLIIKLILTNYFSVLSLTFEKNWSGILLGSRLQGIANIFSIFSYLFFFYGIIKFRRSFRMDSIFLYFLNLFFIFMFSFSFFLSFPMDLVTSFLLSLYPFSIFVLSYSFILISFVLMKYNQKMWQLSIISAFIILIDSIFYIHTFSQGILNNYIDLNIFYQRKVMAMSISLFGSILALIPNFLFFKKLIKKTEIVISSDESVIQRAIKKLLDEYKKIIGDAIFSIFLLAVKNHWKMYNVKIDFDRNYNLKKLSNEEMLRFLNTLIQTFSYITGKVCDKIVRDISKDKEIKETIEKSKFIATEFAIKNF